MAEDFQTRNEQKNTVATVGMRFSILGLIALITLLFAWL
jgi:putative copper export protein